VAAGLLVDDNRQHVEPGEERFERGPARRTVIVLEERQGSMRTNNEGSNRLVRRAARQEGL
jgi:hypothetical protein